MKFTSASLLSVLIPAVSARFVEPGEFERLSLYTDWATKDETSQDDVEMYHIELSPGDTRWVTEDEKWALRRVSISVGDVKSQNTWHPPSVGRAEMEC